LKSITNILADQDINWHPDIRSIYKTQEIPVLPNEYYEIVRDELNKYQSLDKPSESKEDMQIITEKLLCIEACLFAKHDSEKAIEIRNRVISKLLAPYPIHLNMKVLDNILKEEKYFPPPVTFKKAIEKEYCSLKTKILKLGELLKRIE
jgi:hypothetical protein